MRTDVTTGRVAMLTRSASSLLAAILAVGAPFSQSRGAVQSVPDPRDRLERLITDVEGGRRTPELKDAWSRYRYGDTEPLHQELRLAYRSIDSLLARDSADVRTLVLASRLNRASGTYAVEWEEPEHGFRQPANTFDRIRAVLGRGIALNPQSAELHYQLARVCGTLVVRDAGLHPVDRFEAAAECRRAVELDSTRSEYRKYLAVFLLMGPHPDDAEPVVRGHKEFDRLHALVADWAALPNPPNTVTDFHGYDEQQGYLFNNVIDDWTIARVRVLAFDGPASALESYYASVMPGFRLYPADGPDQYGNHRSRQVLVMQQGRYAPSMSAKECMHRKPWSGPMMDILVTEYAVSPGGLVERLGMTHDPYCIVTISNWRRPKSIDDGR